MTLTAALVAMVACVGLVLGVGVARAGVHAASSAPAAPNYTVTFLPNPLSSPLIPYGLNDNGDVVGYSGGSGSPYRAWLYTDGSGTTLLPNLPGKRNGFGYGVNNTGQVAGSSGYQNIEPLEQATRWTNGAPQSLGTLGTDSQGRAINSLGNVAGYSYVNGQPHAFFWSPQRGMADMIPGNFSSYGYGLNDSNQAAGVDASLHQAFRWNNGTLQRLGVPSPWAYSNGFAINRSGQVAGSVMNITGNNESFAIYTNGIGWKVIAKPGIPNQFRGINDNGDAVGIGHFNQFQRGYVYLNGLGLYSVTNQVAGGGWQIWDAWAINNAGQIIGYGVATDGSGRAGAVRLTPTSSSPPANTSPPTISGSAVQGQTLVGAPGSWTGSPPPTFAYQWQRCDSTGGNCAAIGGATSSTYNLVGADVGSTLVLQVTGSNSAGSAGPVTSVATRVVASLLAPVTPILDSFNRADGGVGPNWSPIRPTGFATMSISGNAAVNSSTTQFAWNFWNAATVGPDSEAYVTISRYTAPDAIRIGARVNNAGTSTPSGYYVSVSPTGAWSIVRIDWGPSVTLASGVTQTLSSGDKLAIRLVGSVVTALHYTNARGWVQVLSYDTTPDTIRYTTPGRLALEFKTSTLDDFGGGTV